MTTVLDCPECKHRFEYTGGIQQGNITCPVCGNDTPSANYSALLFCPECRSKLSVPLRMLRNPSLSCPRCRIRINTESSSIPEEDDWEATFSPDLPERSSRQLLHAGDFFDKYEIQRLLGRGGMGEVYLAKHLLLMHQCALKVLKPGNSDDDPVFVKRFIREAKLANQINHPNIIKVFDVGSDLKTGYLFISMEFIDGESLSSLLRRGKFTEEEIRFVAREMGKALTEMELRKIIHRDIKPSNIMLDKNGTLKLTDLGIAKVESDHATGEMTLTQEHVAIGTPSYASPEQCETAHRVDCRSDLYSLGATLYHLASGKVPFDGETPMAILLNVVRTEPEPLEKLCPELSPDVVDLIESLMEKNPERRPQNAHELLKRLTQPTDQGKLLQKLRSIKLWKKTKAQRRILLENSTKFWKMTRTPRRKAYRIWQHLTPLRQKIAAGVMISGLILLFAMYSSDQSEGTAQEILQLQPPNPKLRERSSPAQDSAPNQKTIKKERPPQQETPPKPPQKSLTELPEDLLKKTWKELPAQLSPKLTKEQNQEQIPQLQQELQKRMPQGSSPELSQSHITEQLKKIQTASPGTLPEKQINKPHQKQELVQPPPLPANAPQADSSPLPPEDGAPNLTATFQSPFPIEVPDATLISRQKFQTPRTLTERLKEIKHQQKHTRTMLTTPLGEQHKKILSERLTLLNEMEKKLELNRQYQEQQSLRRENPELTQRLINTLQALDKSHTNAETTKQAKALLMLIKRRDFNPDTKVTAPFLSRYGFNSSSIQKISLLQLLLHYSVYSLFQNHQHELLTALLLRHPQADEVLQSDSFNRNSIPLLLLDTGLNDVEVRKKQYDNKSLLAKFATHDSEWANTLILLGANVNSLDLRKRTPLHYAAAANNVKLLRKLLLLGANPSLIDIYGETPLHAAIAVQAEDSAEVLRQFGAPQLSGPELQRAQNQALFTIALKDGQTTKMKECLKKGADINRAIPDETGILPPIVYCVKSRLNTSLKFLIENNAQEISEYRMLFRMSTLIARMDNIEGFRLLAQQLLPVYDVIFRYASPHTFKSCLRIIKQQQIDLNTPLRNGMTLIEILASSNAPENIPKLKLLLDNGICPSSPQRLIQLISQNPKIPEAECRRLLQQISQNPNIPEAERRRLTQQINERPDLRRPGLNPGRQSRSR